MRAFRATAREVIDAALPEVNVLGIDETRRGRTKWGRTPTAASPYSVHVAVHGLTLILGERPLAQRGHDPARGRDEPLAGTDQVQELQSVVDPAHGRLERLPKHR